MSRASWLCVVLAFFTAAAVLWVFGLDWLTATVATAIVLSCPVVLALAMREGARVKRELDQFDTRKNHG